MKRFKKIILVMAVLAVGILVMWLIKNSGKPGDFRMALAGDSGIELFNYSMDRKIVSRVLIPAETEIWVPGGYGWYQSGKINRLLINEKKQYLWPDVLFYNLGFDTKYWQEAKVGEENDSAIDLIKNWGWLQWLRYKIDADNWLVKEETIFDLSDYGRIDQLMLQDMADSRLVSEDGRIMIYNSTTENGLASFMGRILERAGLTVTGWENSDTINEVCQIKSGTNWQKLQMADIMKRKFPKCGISVDKDMPENEAEIYFGQGFAQMINYQSYQKGL